MKKRKIIVVFCHSRALLLDQCLSSLKNAYGFNEWHLIVIQQTGFLSVDKVLKKHTQMIHTLVSIKPNFSLPLSNINYNRVIGTKYAFEFLNAEYVLGIEEDNLVSKDSLIFIDRIYDGHKSNIAFRGINLGSVEHHKSISKNSYSLLRFGLHGSAGVLTKKSWKYIQRHNLFNFDLNNSSLAWDANIEFYLKSGYMVTPNITRNLDLGYGGTFAPRNKNDEYFVSIKKSWLENSRDRYTGYEKNQIKHNWRKDAIAYRKRDSFIYILRRNTILGNLIKNLVMNSVLSKTMKKVIHVN
jgi:hypothetical protein